MFFGAFVVPLSAIAIFVAFVIFFAMAFFAAGAFFAAFTILVALMGFVASAIFAAGAFGVFAFRVITAHGSLLCYNTFFFYLVWDFEFIKLLPKLNIQLCLNIILRPVPWDLPLCGLWLRVYLLFFAAEFDLLPLILMCRRCCALDDAKMNVPPV